MPDGFRVDIHGSVWTICRSDVVRFAKHGAAPGKILSPLMIFDLTFGGPQRNRLFVTATKSVCAVYLATADNWMPWP